MATDTIRILSTCFQLLLMLTLSGKVCGYLRVEEIPSGHVKVEKLNDKIYKVSMDENNHSWNGTKTPLFHIVTNGTLFLDSAITFTKAYFKNDLTNNSGKIIMNADQYFDYETQAQSYSFRIATTDEYINVDFNINNIDDENPSLTSPQCEMEERKMYDATDSPCFCTLSDPDGWLNKTTFTLWAVGNSESDEEIRNTFDIAFRQQPNDTTYTTTVYVILRQQLDFEKKMVRIFDIEAKDSANHSTTPPKVRALVNVKNVRHSKPVWSRPVTSATVTEKSLQTIEVAARDGDIGISAPVFYEITSQDLPDEKYIVLLDNTKGVIQINNIDRDKFDLTTFNFSLKAYVKDKGGPWETGLNTTLFVTDIDDNPPLFRRMVNTTDPNKVVIFKDGEEKRLIISFLENYNQSFHIDLFIQDIDTGENAQFDVKLVNTNLSFPFTDAFMIIPNKGYRNGIFDISVQDKRNLDYENPDWRSLSFEVHVTGTKNNTKMDKLYVDVSLIDYNDEIPTFPQTEYTISINETAPKGYIIIQVEATDRDAEDKKLRHELIGTANVLKLLDIETETGWISVKIDNAFDYDKLNPIFVQVRAVDKVNHTTSVPVSIKLLDVNNKAPIITNDDVIEVEENQPTGMKLSATIRATDPDTEPELVATIDWEASYATKNAIRLNMSDEEIAKRVKFLDISSSLDPNDPDEKQIIISLSISKENQDKTTPDYELFDVLHLSIVVTDLLTDPAFPDKRSTTTPVMITIVDVIDNTPYFPEYLPNGLPKPINRTVLEAADKGTTVGNLRAYDLDIRAKLSYKCDPDDENFDWITVDAPSGDIVVKDGAYIDADTNETYYFNYTCYANDSIHASEALNVKIYILDTNNKIPVLTNLADNTELKIEEKSHKDTNVFKIEYHDEDRDYRFHTVRCSIIGGTNDNTRKCSDEFYIRDNEIKVKFGDDHLNRDEGDKYYNCTAECKDNPDKDDERQNKVAVIFSIKLLDINDHDPILIEPNAGELQKGIQVSENYKKGATLFKLKGLDIDEGLNGAIVFDITEPNATNLKLFKVNQIDDKNAEIQAGEDLKDHYGKYGVSFLLHDKGTPPRSSHNETTIEISKFNYEQPRFVYPADDTQEILFSDQELNSPLYRFNQSGTLPDFYASDSKGTQTCTKWDITMEMEQIAPNGYPTMFHLKRIDKCKYQLQINERYKKEDAVTNRFNIKLTARVKEGKEMKGEAPYTVTTSLQLTFTDNKQQPTFEKSTWTFTLTEADANQHSKLGVGAHYPGNIDRPIFYYIVDDKQNNPALEYFKVNVSTGEVTLKKELEYLKFKKYSFQIIASNDSNLATSTNPLSKLNVICNVEEINRYPPVFNKPVFYGALLTTSQKGAVLVSLKATDPDELDQDQLTYQIHGDIENESNIKNIKDPFKLDSKSGDISLNFSVDGGMSGYFTFQVMVQDKEDKYKNGPHNATASTIIFIITPEFTTRFRFMNSMDQVRENEEQMLDVIKGILGFEPNIQAKGTDDRNQAFVNLYFIESKAKLMGGRAENHLGVDVVKGSVIQRKVGDIGIYQKLYQELYTRAKLTLLSFPSEPTSDDLQTTVRNWLIGVSVILGVLCFGLVAAFLFKMRQLKNTISRLTDRRFSDVGEKLDIAAPNTNKHAIEGSNPIFTSDVAKAPKDNNDFEIGDFDRKSVVSGDSDLIGVENNPEFDLAFSEGINEAKNYI